jgi:hypothetical protein
LMVVDLYSSETSVLTRATWNNIPEDGILHRHLSENLKSYTCLIIVPFKNVAVKKDQFCSHNQMCKM